MKPAKREFILYLEDMHQSMQRIIEIEKAVGGNKGITSF